VQVGLFRDRLDGMINTDRSRPFTWTTTAHTPIERSHERQGGFVLVGGWQCKYDPTPAHREALFERIAAEAVEARQRG
jgi:hypothetical protein